MLLILSACSVSSVFNQEVFAQDTTEQTILVTGEEVPSAYGAPPGLSRSRFSNTTQAYVLPPWSFFFGELFEGTGFRHGPPDYLFTQEILSFGLAGHWPGGSRLFGAWMAMVADLFVRGGLFMYRYTSGRWQNVRV